MTNINDSSMKRERTSELSCFPSVDNHLNGRSHVISYHKQSPTGQNVEETGGGAARFQDMDQSLNKRVVCFYPREDRGAIVIFELDSRRDLAKILRKWRSFVRARLDVYPLQDPEQSEKMLVKKRNSLVYIG